MISKRYAYDGKPSIFLNKIQLEAKANVEKKIKTGKYKFEYVNCNVCGANNSELISEKDRFGLKHEVVICRECGLVYNSPRLSQESYNDFYNKEYRKLYLGKETASNEFFKNQVCHGQRIYDYLKESIQMELKSKKVLEIGCGAGGILSYFKEKGCIVKGVDLGGEYISFGKKNYGLDLLQGSLSDVDISFKPDIIIYSHVMEHILDLNYELEELRKYCNNNTILYIEVPGIREEKDPMIAFQNAHVFYFSATSLKNIFKKNGYNLICADEFVHSIFKLDLQNEKYVFENDYVDTKLSLYEKERRLERSIFRKILKIKKFFFPKPISLKKR